MLQRQEPARPTTAAEVVSPEWADFVATVQEAIEAWWDHVVNSPEQVRNRYVLTVLQHVTAQPEIGRFEHNAFN